MAVLRAPARRDRVRRPHDDGLARSRGDRRPGCASARPARSRRSSRSPRVAARSHVPEDWAAASAFPVAANALLASFKIWNTATVGGNVCQSFCAGIDGLARRRALDGEAVIWTPDGGERRQSVAIADDRQRHEQPRRRGGAARDRAARARAALPRCCMRKIALAELGRSGAVVTGRVDADGLGRLHGHGRDPHAGRAALRRAAGCRDPRRGGSDARPATTATRSAPPTGGGA